MSDHQSRCLTVDELASLVRQGAIDTVALAVVDLYGRPKGKRLNAAPFLERLPAGAEMCDYVLATDYAMTPLPGFDLAGWHNGFGDLRIVPELHTIRRLIYDPGTVMVFGTALHHDGQPVDVAPRQMLQRQIDRLAKHGHQARIGVESEAFFFKGSPERVRSRGFQQLAPVFPHNADYALDHSPALVEFFDEIRSAVRRAGARVEAIKTEGAPGQVEVTWPHTDPMSACDNYTVYKHAVRHVAARNRMTPTFMAAPYTGLASGLHLHVSLWRDGAPVFDTDSAQDMPEPLHLALAGSIAALPHLVPLYAPTENSFLRYRPHSFAPVNYTYGIDNRTTAFRVAGHGEHTRIETRLAGADANIYNAVAAVLAGFVYGLDHQPKLPAPCSGDAYKERDAPCVPRNLEEALLDFRESTLAGEALTDPVVAHYARAAEVEIAAGQGQVPGWQRERGFLHA
ncbi:glutamine synthetase family protein [Streptomyces sp. NPDC059786]|uniref:glutamine synthetase family protein n=1 Tax=Streptomyces sp. NPDC059786 TaxID=3346946 RepID=UPI00366231EA